MYLARNLKYLRERNGEMQKDIAELLAQVVERFMFHSEKAKTNNLLVADMAA